LTLDEYKEWIYEKTMPLIELMGGKITPNQLSVISLLCAFLAGSFIYLSKYNPLYLIVSLIFIILNGLFDVLDGGLARYLKVEGDRGDFLDHVFDRYSDIFMLLGVFFGGYCSPETIGTSAAEMIGISAIIGVLLTSYMGTQAQAVGLKRSYGGILGRADRMMILSIFLVLQLLFNEIFGIKLLTFAMVIFAVFGNVTAVQRFFYAWKRLD
jgi:Phosphatidylglycerophosphate synthase